MIDEYSKKEILGYVIMALMNAGKSKEEIKLIVSKMDEVMDEWTEVYAEQIHDNFFGI